MWPVVLGRAGEQTGSERQGPHVSPGMWTPGGPALNIDCGQRQERGHDSSFMWRRQRRTCRVFAPMHSVLCTRMCVCVFICVCLPSHPFLARGPSVTLRMLTRHVRDCRPAGRVCVFMYVMYVWGLEDGGGGSLSRHITSFPVK